MIPSMMRMMIDSGGWRRAVRQTDSTEYGRKETEQTDQTVYRNVKEKEKEKEKLKAKDLKK